MSTPSFQPKLARRSQNLQASFIREILKITAQKDVISFAGGLPNPAFFPVDAIKDATAKVLSADGPNVLQYTVTEGYRPLKEFIANRYAEKNGVQLTPEEILLTNGSQQGMDLIGKLMLNPGDELLVEDPSFIGAIQAFGIFEPTFVPVLLEQDGMNTEALEQMLRQTNANLCYTVPNYQNPTGFTYSKEKREAIARLLQQHEVLMVEDNPYGEINFTGRQYPSFQSLYPEGTLLMGSFSKTVSPGMRMGWITAPVDLMEKLVIIKQAADTHSNYFAQRVLHQYLSDNDLDLHIAGITEAYQLQCKTMVSAIEQYFPEAVKVSVPDGGMFIWGELPVHLDARDFFQRAIQRKVAFVPAQAFYAQGNVKHTFRLNFSNTVPELIEEGIQRLGDCLKELLSGQKN